MQIKSGKRMSMQDCIFCKIIEKQVPAEVIEENDDVLVIKDIAPKAPIHYLIIPKRHVKDVASLDEQASHYAGKILHMAKQLSEKLNGSRSFRLIMNNGADAGQSVFHLHCHFISGKHLSDF